MERSSAQRDVGDLRRRHHIQESGRGTQPMLFAHGFGCDQQMWRFVAPAFEPTHRVVLFDHVGCGRSDLSAYDDERHGSLGGYAQDVLDIAAALDLRDIVFVGHSVSAMIGVIAAIREPARFARLVLVAPSPCYIDDPPDYVGGFARDDLEGVMALMERNQVGWASFLAPLVMHNADRPELTRELEASFCATDPHIAQRFARVTFFSDNRADLPQLRVPSLILQCSDDSIAPRSVGAYMHRHLADSRLRELDVSGHCPHMSHPQATIDAISAYLGD